MVRYPPYLGTSKCPEETHLYSLSRSEKTHSAILNTVVQPIQHFGEDSIHIMWSSLSLPISLQENVELNHFVPLLPMSSVDQSEEFTVVRGRKWKLSETLPRNISSTASLSKNIPQYDDTSRKATSRK